MILSVGYRVNSVRGIMFRRWSSEVLKQFMLRGFSVNQHLISLQERIDNRFSSLESRVDDHEQKIDFLIKKEEPVTEQLLGASVKDMGRGLCTIIKLGFNPEEILNRI